MKTDKSYQSSIRRKIILSLLILVPLGFATKFYSGPAWFWVQNSLSGVFYEIFWCLVLCFFLTNAAAWKIGAWVFIGTSALEFFQLIHPKILEAIRSHFIGRTLIGTQFSWLDFLYYLIGCSIGCFWIVQIRKQFKS
jgi:hypothetical protein